MEEKDLLLEGGAAGHMNHLYDNGDLTFAKMKEIFSAAAEGKLEGTEKTDGQNLMISYSVHDGRAKGVRNKTEIKGGGLTPEQLAAKFADRANPALKDTFKDALKAFERAIQGLSHEEQVDLFGEDTNIYYNAEVMDPRTPNVISYDTKTLVIHRAGHADFDRQTGERRDTDLSQKSAKLEDIISNAQDRLKGEEYGVQVNAIKRLKALSNNKPLNSAISKLNSVMSSVNYLIGDTGLSLGDNSTISEFMMARVYILINSILDREITSIGKVDPVAKMNIAKRILGVKGIKITDIAKKLTPEQKNYVKDNVLNQASMSNILKTAISPVEMVVSDFAAEMLKGLESAFILDNSKEVQRLRAEVNSAIGAIQSSENEEAMRILNTQLKKLKSADNVTATAEGFVFDYDGVTYKFTGNFAPVNQILGLFKYGRGNVPPIKKESLQEARKAVPGLADVAVIPGAFKPPHKGHVAMIEHYSKKAKQVVVLVSPLARTLPDGRAVSFDKSKIIFDMFLDKIGVTNVKVLKSDIASPVQAAFEFVANKENKSEFAQVGQVVMLGSSVKGGDDSRFKEDAQKHAKKGVTVVVEPAPSFYEDMSATTMRQAIANNDVETLTDFMPDKFGNKKEEVAEQIINMFTGAETVPPKEKKKKVKSVKENVIYDMIIETIQKNGDKYCLISKRNKRKVAEKKVQYFKHMKEMSAAGSGAIAGPAIKDERNESSRTN